MDSHDRLHYARWWSWWVVRTAAHAHWTSSCLHASVNCMPIICVVRAVCNVLARHGDPYLTSEHAHLLQFWGRGLAAGLSVSGACDVAIVSRWINVHCRPDKRLPVMCCFDAMQLHALTVAARYQQCCFRPRWRKLKWALTKMNQFTPQWGCVYIFYMHTSLFDK